MTPTETSLSIQNPIPTPTLNPLSVPTFEECVEEYERYFADKDAGRISHAGIPDGNHVAYYGGHIHGYDPDPVALRARVAAALRVHPARVVVHYPFWW